MDTSISLLNQLSQSPNSEAWEQLVSLYTPLLRNWLRNQDGLPAEDLDDLVQEVLLSVSRELPNFQHNQQRGAFRKWLRLILVHRLRNYWRSRQRHPSVVGGTDFLQWLEKLEDDGSQLSAAWDRQHNQHVLEQLLRETETQFAGHIWQAFRMQVLERIPASQVATELNMSLSAVYTAKSRVLNLLRQLAGDFLS